MRNPEEHFCPICGVKFSEWSKHKCNPASLRATDSANRRLELDEDREATGRREFWRTETRRMIEGLQEIEKRFNGDC
jgi:hypothetical protein